MPVTTLEIEQKEITELCHGCATVVLMFLPGASRHEPGNVRQRENVRQLLFFPRPLLPFPHTLCSYHVWLSELISAARPTACIAWPGAAMDCFSQHKEQHDIYGKKKRARAEEHTFNEVDRWDRSDTTDPEILNHIRKFLDGCNHEAGILHVPGRHTSLALIPKGKEAGILLRR